MSKKKLIIIILLIMGVIILLLTLSGQSTPTTSSASVQQLDETITQQSLLQDPEAYKGKVVKITGRIFNIETESGNTAFQIWSDPENSEGNIIVYTEGTNEAIAENNYVEVIGEVRGKFTGDNAFGASLSVPAITALEIKKVDRNIAVAPSHTTVEGKAQTKNGITITVEKIEFAEEETRVVLSVKNSAKGTINFYGFNSKLVQNNSQVKEKTIFNADGDYDIPSDILAGTTEKGILFFEKSDSSMPFKLHLQATTADYTTVNFDFSF